MQKTYKSSCRLRHSRTKRLLLLFRSFRRLGPSWARSGAPGDLFINLRHSRTKRSFARGRRLRPCCLYAKRMCFVVWPSPLSHETLTFEVWPRLAAPLGPLMWLLGPLLGTSWAPLGLLGASWASGAPLGVLLGSSWAPLGRLLGTSWASWAPLGQRHEVPYLLHPCPSSKPDGSELML